jgi:hypothetical protein
MVKLALFAELSTDCELTPPSCQTGLVAPL